jgi:hypothetical protein
MHLSMSIITWQQLSQPNCYAVAKIYLKVLASNGKSKIENDPLVPVGSTARDATDDTVKT